MFRQKDGKKFEVTVELNDFNECRLDVRMKYSSMGLYGEKNDSFMAFVDFVLRAVDYTCYFKISMGKVTAAYYPPDEVEPIWMQYPTDDLISYGITLGSD